MKFQDFQVLFFSFSRTKIRDHNIVIIFQILINKQIKQNGTNKVQHMQSMQWLWQLERIIWIL